MTAQADLDGVFNRLGINLSSPIDSNIRASQITAGGTRYLLCNEVAITSIANCPSMSLLTYSITQDSDAARWRITNLANPADSGVFSIARVGGEKVYLAAGVIQQTSGSFRVFRIGLMDSPTLAASTARGGDTLGTRGSVTLTSTAYTGRGINPDGSAANADYGVISIAPTGPLGIWAINTGGSNAYFGVHSGKLTAVVSARGANAGYMQIGLVD